LNPSETNMEFSRWAFGDKWIDYLCLDADITDLAEAWNVRHGSHFKIENWDEWPHCLSKMKKIWERNLQNIEKKV